MKGYIVGIYEGKYKIKMSQNKIQTVGGYCANCCSISLRTIYDVANNEQIDAIKRGGMAAASPGKNAKISVVARAVRVMATFTPAAVHKTITCIGIAVSGTAK